MAETDKSAYPLAAYNFRVSVGGDTPMSFAEVSGLKREHQTVTYRHGRSFKEGEEIAKFHIDKYESITARRGTVRGKASEDLYKWLETSTPTSMKIDLCDSGKEGKPLISWTIDKALPVKIEAPTFDAKANEVSIESLEIKVAGVRLAVHE